MGESPGMKGIRIIHGMKNLLWEIYAVLFAACFLIPLTVFLKNGYPELNSAIVIKSCIYSLIIAIVTGLFIWLLLRRLFVRLKDMQKLCRMLWNSRFFLTDSVNTPNMLTDKKEIKRKIAYFPKIYYKRDKKHIKVTIALDGSKFQRNFTELAETLEQMFFCDVVETQIKDGFIQYILLHDVQRDRLTIDNVTPKKYTIPLMKNLSWDIVRTPHALIVGGTGGGKTYFIFCLIEALLKMKAEVTICDIKQADLAELAGVMPNVTYKEGGIVSAIRRVTQEMMERYEYLRSLPNYTTGKDFSYYNLPPKFIIVDEYVALLERMKKSADKNGKADRESFESCVSQIVLMGRQAGVFLILATQRPDAQYLSGNVRDQLGARISLGQMSTDGYKMTFGQVDKSFVNPTERGMGYIYLDGTTPNVRKFVSPYVPTNHNFKEHIARLYEGKGEQTEAIKVESKGEELC